MTATTGTTRNVYNALLEHGPMRGFEIEDMLDHHRGGVAVSISRMLARGQIRRRSDRRYEVAFQEPYDVAMAISGLESAVRQCRELGVSDALIRCIVSSGERP